MPRLSLFAPCERVILGQGDNSASLIVVIQQIQFQGLAGQPPVLPPLGAGVPGRFSLFSQWYQLPTDGNTIFEQRITLSTGNENPVLEAMTEFQMTDRVHRLIANVIGFPFMNPGEYSLKLFLRPKGQQNWGNAIADYPLEVAHILQPAIPANQ
ncbi:MAG TPA: hypothetical protein VJN89_19140 [Candidatus Acidoferrum sp.]|nr:hypothetical protein [Candidatus Acidoferrum sp.]